MIGGEQRKSEQRENDIAFFGGGRWLIETDDGPTAIPVGDTVLDRDRGGGWARWPLALDRYAGVLRLRMPHRVVLMVMLSYRWRAGRYVFPSWNRIATESGYHDDGYLRGVRRQLEKMGYVRNAGIVPQGEKHAGQVKYDLQPLFEALAMARAVDPTSTFSKTRGAPLPRSTVERYGWRFDFDALDAIIGGGVVSGDTNGGADEAWDDGAEAIGWSLPDNDGMNGDGHVKEYLAVEVERMAAE